ncbi:MAG: hypothetical protein NZ774_00170 [Candidatus Poseidoniales archaeon]|nr:hypothetical protein [Candidatus Poseidoniales archaeon]
MQSAALEMLNLPALRSNPFDTRPLSREQLELMVGRDEVFTALANNIRLSSPRVVAVVGEKGSGRSSLVQCVASTADQIHTVFWPSGDLVTTILHQMYCDLMKDFETPPVHSVMIDRLEEELAGRTGLLPVIIFDHSLLSGPVLAEVLSQLMPVLTKIRALTIITLTPGQKSGFPEELLSEMDVTPPLESLTRADMARLIGKRVHKASRSSWTAPEALLDMVMKESGGHVGRAMRFLRDVVDHTRGMPLIDGRKLDLKVEISPKPTTVVEDSTFQRVVDATPPLNEVNVKVSETAEIDTQSEEIPFSNDGEEETPSGSESATTIETPIEIPEFDESQTLFPSLSDAADMWKDLGDDNGPQLDLTEDTDVESSTQDSEESAIPSENESDSETVESSSEVDDGKQWKREFSDEMGGAEVLEMADGTAPTFGGGRFGGLRSRNRTARIDTLAENKGAPRKTQGPREAKPNEEESDPNYLRRINTNDQNTELWVQDGMDSPLGNSPTIEPQQMQPNANVPENASDAEATPQPSTPFEETKEWQDETPVEESESWDERPEATPEEVLTALSSIRRVAPPSEPDVVLDINALTNLNNAETLILTEAVEREVSPSDNFLQEELEVGRPRLSQIFNGLLKSGILTVRKQGRSRMYRISAPAKDHLINLGAGGEF